MTQLHPEETPQPSDAPLTALQRATVAVVRVKEGVPQAVREAMELARWTDYIAPQADVSLKVNLGWDLFLPGAVTSPWVVEGVIQTIGGYVSTISVVESDQILVSCERALRQTRIDRVCQRWGARWVNMSRGPFHKVPLQGGLVWRQVELPQVLTRTQLITIPVMKTHNKTTISGALKNQWGCLPELRHNYHLVLDEALVDINRVARPRFAVMDGTVALEGKAPKSGVPRVVDLVLASGDPVALDSIAARIMGFDGQHIPHLNLCREAGLGTNLWGEIVVVGEEIGEMNLGFVPASHNAVSWLELLLRRSFVRPLVFQTPLLRLGVMGALLWYACWYAVKGRKLRDAVLRHPVYGSQWR